MTRVLSAVIGLPIVVGIIHYGSPGLFFLLVAFVTALSCREYFAMLESANLPGFSWLSTILGLLLTVCFFLEGRFLAEWGLLAIVSLFAGWMLTQNKVEGAIDRVSRSLFGILYVAGLLGFYLLIRYLEDGRYFIFFLFLIVWGGDSAAYYFGKKFGKNPLAPTISPKKTVEGAVAGLAGSVAGGIVAKFWFLADVLSLPHCLIVSFICGMIGQFGDLTESLIKRNAGVKDSGVIIPGHGGMLDRIDSLLFAGPAFYLYYKLFV